LAENHVASPPTGAQRGEGRAGLNLLPSPLWGSVQRRVRGSPTGFCHSYSVTALRVRWLAELHENGSMDSVAAREAGAERSRGHRAWATLSRPSGPQRSMSESLSSIFELGGSHQQASDVVMLASRTYESVYRGHQPAQLIGSATALIVS
jgi:hypothetical protein